MKGPYLDCSNTTALREQYVPFETYCVLMIHTRNICTLLETMKKENSLW